MKLNLVPARTGIQWVKLGVLTFMRQPVALSGLFVAYISVMALLSLLPLVGSVIALAITPAATLGLMAATREAAGGQTPMPAVLVSAFRVSRERLRAMMQLGMIYATGAVIVVGIISLIAPVSVVDGKADPEQTRAAMSLMMLFLMPLFVAFWFAPALVHWHGVKPIKSLFFSIVAVARNFRAFLVYGLTWAAVLAVASFVSSAIALGIGNPALAMLIMIPVALLMASIFMISMYFTFVDCFATEAPTTNDFPPPGPTPS